MDDGTKIPLRAWSAADAIQTALVKRIGCRVIACFSGADGLYGGRIDYDIPNHQPLTEAPEKRQRSARPEETEENRKAREKPAPWLEEWLEKQKAAGRVS